MVQQIHRETTGPELWTQTAGKIDALVAGVGTGGTLTGSGQYLKVMKPSIKVRTRAVPPRQTCMAPKTPTRPLECDPSFYS